MNMFQAIKLAVLLLFYFTARVGGRNLLITKPKLTFFTFSEKGSHCLAGDQRKR